MEPVVDEKNLDTSLEDNYKANDGMLKVTIYPNQVEGEDSTTFKGEGNIVSEDEANDQYFIGALKRESYIPEIDDFDPQFNKEEPLSEKISNIASATADATGSVGIDTARAVLKGADKGAENTMMGLADLLGLPVDAMTQYVVNPIYKMLGFDEVENPFMGSEFQKKGVKAYIDLVNSIVPAPIEKSLNEFANQPYDSPIYGTIMEEIAKFGITAIPAAKIVGLTQHPNKILRGITWGGIADYLAINPEDPLLATTLMEYFEINKDEFEPWVKNTISLIEKHDTDGETTQRLKNMLEGGLIGGTVEALIKGILIASKKIPWQQLAKTVTPAVAAGGGITFSDDAEGNPLSAVLKGAVKSTAKNVPEVIKKDVDYLGFYSKALEESKNLKQEKGTGEQFKAMLLKAGVKPDEIEWTGLDELLAKDKVTKKEIIDLLEANKVKLNEVEKIGSEDDAFLDFSSSEDNVRLDDLYLKDVAKGNDEPDKKLLKSTLTAEEAYGAEYLNNRADEIFEDYGEGTNLTIDDAYNQAVDEYYDNPIRIYEATNGYVITGNDDVGYQIFRNKADSSSWKNRLKTMNQDEDIYSLDEAKVQAQMLAADSGDILFQDDAAKYADYTLGGGDNYRELLLTFDGDKKVLYIGGHFEEENIVAHIRVKDRKLGDKKVLYIEEIQSDWGQKGRQDGFKLSDKEIKDLEIEIEKLKDEHKKEINKFTFKDGDKQIPFADWYYARRKELANKDLFSDKKISDNYKGLDNAFFDQLKAGYVYQNGKVVRGAEGFPLYKKIQDVYSKINLTDAKKYKKIPKAPFVTDTNKWTTLTIKRILAKASAEGYDAVAITPGSVHVDRWNEPGLANFYDNIVPKIAKKIVGKLDGKITRLPRAEDAVDDMGKKVFYNMDDNDVAFDGALLIDLTPNLKNKTQKGQALFAIPAGGAFIAGTQTQTDSNT